MIWLAVHCSKCCATDGFISFNTGSTGTNADVRNRAGGRGWSNADRCGQGEGVKNCHFYADVLYGRPLAENRHEAVSASTSAGDNIYAGDRFRPLAVAETLHIRPLSNDDSTQSHKNGYITFSSKPNAHILFVLYIFFYMQHTWNSSIRIPHSKTAFTSKRNIAKHFIRF
jgi:hypothetical protein